jgi:xanthine/uracil permease
VPPTVPGRGRPPGRYGDAPRRPRPGVIAAVVVVAAAFVGWVVWAALGAVDREPQAEVTAFRIVSAESMKVRVRLAVGTEGPIGCTVQAMDRTREVVGVAGVELRAGRKERWVSVRTRDRAVTAMVASCLAR